MSTIQSFDDFKRTILNALADYEYQRVQDLKQDKELTDVIAKLTIQKQELEAKVKELSEVVAKFAVNQPPKQVIHG
jgi:hypothetical protein